MIHLSVWQYDSPVSPGEYPCGRWLPSNETQAPPPCSDGRCPWQVGPSANHKQPPLIPAYQERPMTTASIITLLLLISISILTVMLSGVAVGQWGGGAMSGRGPRGRGHPDLGQLLHRSVRPESSPGWDMLLYHINMLSHSIHMLLYHIITL